MTYFMLTVIDSVDCLSLWSEAFHQRSSKPFNFSELTHSMSGWRSGRVDLLCVRMYLWMHDGATITQRWLAMIRSSDPLLLLLLLLNPCCLLCVGGVSDCFIHTTPLVTRRYSDATHDSAPLRVIGFTSTVISFFDPELRGHRKKASAAESYKHHKRTIAAAAADTSATASSAAGRLGCWVA